MTPIYIRIDGKLKAFEPNSKECMHALNQIAGKMQSPSFHVGDLSEDLLRSGYTKADTLAFAIECNRFDSPGTGHFTTSNLTDVLEWKEQRKEDNKKSSKKMDLYCIDLERYKSNAIIIENDDEMWEYATYLESISKAVISNTKYKSPQNAMTIGMVYGTYKQEFEYLNISYTEFSNWVKNKASEINCMTKDDLRVCDSVSTSFQRHFLGISAIDLSLCNTEDSVARGNIIFDINIDSPYDINFGDNEELAIAFAKMVTEKCLEKKLEHIDTPEDAEQLYYSYEAQMSPATKEKIKGKIEQLNIPNKPIKKTLSFAERAALAKARAEASNHAAMSPCIAKSPIRS